VAIVGRYVGLAWEKRVVQARATSVDNQIRLLGGQCKMRLEVNALGLFCFETQVNFLNEHAKSKIVDDYN